jgi:type IV pilus assembly protein PilQ
MKIQILTALIIFVSITSLAQRIRDIDSIAIHLEGITKEYPGLKETVEFSVSGVSVKEFVRTLANNHDLNISVSDDVQGIVINNFSNAKVSDVLIFLCKEYQLSIDFMGSIMSFHSLDQQEIDRKLALLNAPPRVIYDNSSHFLSLDLKNDTLESVIKEIVDMTFVNVLPDPDVRLKPVSVYIRNRPLESALEMLALSNNLEIEKKGANFYVIKNKYIPPKPADGNGISISKKDIKSSIPLQVEVLKSGNLNVVADNASIKDILKEVSKRSFRPYFLYDEPQGSASIFVENVSFESLLDYILNSSNLTFRQQDGVYLIGERNDEILRTTELVQLENRTVESVLEYIPVDMKSGVEVKEFTELNGLVLSGSRPNIEEIKRFLFSIDQVVPVVKIEVMIIDYQKSHGVTAGIDMKLGVGDTPDNSSYAFGGEGANATLNSNTVNNLLSAFNGFGAVNLGPVQPDFYMTIQALETNGNLKVRSTPILSTLNGHESSLTIGNTEYYLEVNNNIIGTQNPITQQQQIYKAVNADLSLTIKPHVSSDEQVTLEITVNQSDFTARISETAPPGQVTREFKSLIRMRNGEMILLGGLEEKSVTETGQGLPLLSRIPVLKWIFGKRSKIKSKSKLHVFIKPVVIY